MHQYRHHGRRCITTISSLTPTTASRLFNIIACSGCQSAFLFYTQNDRCTPFSFARVIAFSLVRATLAVELSSCRRVRVLARSCAHPAPKGCSGLTTVSIGSLGFLYGTGGANYITSTKSRSQTFLFFLFSLEIIFTFFGIVSSLSIRAAPCTQLALVVCEIQPGIFRKLQKLIRPKHA